MLAEVIGVTRRSIVRWRAHGIPWYAADRAACALGFTPHMVWPDFNYEELDEAWDDALVA